LLLYRITLRYHINVAQKVATAKREREVVLDGAIDFELVFMENESEKS
jgi:hypothetical protein